VVEDVGALVHLDGEKFAPNEQNVGQAFGFVDVAQRFPRFRRSFTPFDVRQLLVHQARGNDGEGFLASSLVRLFDLVARRGRWRQLRPVHDLPKIFGGHHHLQLELVEVEIVAAKFVERDVAIPLA